MIWSWWPDVGFEPRYGGDVAFGAFAIANFLTYKDRLNQTQEILRETEPLDAFAGRREVENATACYKRAKGLLQEAANQFDDGWYSLGVAKIDEASAFAKEALRELRAYLPMAESRDKLEATEKILGGIILTLILLTILSVYWQRKLSQMARERTSTALSSRH